MPQNERTHPGETANENRNFRPDVQAEGDEAYLHQLASFVDEKMRTVAETTRQVDSTRVAVLASLNIADELFTLRRRQEELEGPLRKRVEKCVNLVEKALESSH
jgi:cell division protein ZapA